ncbi:MAG: GNAT family N-acetyltransferase [Actinomycetes bacterium]
MNLRYWSNKNLVRPLVRTDIQAVLDLALQDEISNCFLINRLQELQQYTWSLQNEFVVYEENGKIESAVYSGANIIPLNTFEKSQIQFAQYLLDQPKRISSIVGSKEEVLSFWQILKPFMPSPREIRPTQPLLVIDDSPLVAPDQFVQPALMRDLDLLIPACVSMFTEEVGISPVGEISEKSYRNRVAEVINQRKMFARIENNQVLFKAEIGVSTDKVCQVQGVWVPPHLRGRNLGKSGMASVVNFARQNFAPKVSLYVNDYNHRAQFVYKSVGFQEHSTFATILF